MVSPKTALAASAFQAGPAPSFAVRTAPVISLPTSGPAVFEAGGFGGAALRGGGGVLLQLAIRTQKSAISLRCANARDDGGEAAQIPARISSFGSRPSSRASLRLHAVPPRPRAACG